MLSWLLYCPHSGSASPHCSHDFPYHPCAQDSRVSLRVHFSVFRAVPLGCPKDTSNSACPSLDSLSSALKPSCYFAFCVSENGIMHSTPKTRNPDDSLSFSSPGNPAVPPPHPFFLLSVIPLLPPALILGSQLSSWRESCALQLVFLLPVCPFPV